MEKTNFKTRHTYVATFGSNSVIHTERERFLRFSDLFSWLGS